MSVLLLPNGEQIFLDNNGIPLALGTVGLYVPGTMTPKDTWQDPDQAAFNTNPINLDAGGRCKIWGAGYYRQIVKDSLSNIIWDRVTSAGNGQDVYWGGLSGGAPNLQTITAPGFAFVDGAMVNWTALFTNTGALFIDVNGIGAIQLFANTAAGAAPLIGGEVVAGNIISMVADTSLGGYRLISGSAATRNLNVLGTFARSGVLTPAALTIDTDDWAPPGIENASILRISSTVAINLSGIDAPLINGTFYTLDNIGTFRITLLNNSVLSQAGNRFISNAPVILEPGGSGAIHYDALSAGWRIDSSLASASAQRTVLSANRTYFVRTDGSDANTGLANNAGGAFLTWQKAVDTAAGLDFNGFVVEIRAGQTGVTFTTGCIVPPMTGQKDDTDFVLTGDATTPSNVLMSVSAGIAFQFVGGARGLVQGFEIRATGAGVIGINPDGMGTTVVSGNLVFGPSAAGQHIKITDGAYYFVNNDYAITGGAADHIYVDGYGQLLVPTGIPNKVVTLTGTPAFTDAFVAVINYGKVEAHKFTFSGGATGKRYDAQGFGMIWVGGAGGSTFFPGNAAGTSGDFNTTPFGLYRN